jgi:xanthine dehydrogenase/oxidase
MALTIVDSENIKVKNSFEFYVNSDHKKITSIDPSITLLEYLRENEYFGTKYGCGEGGCGACTVVIAEFDANQNQVKYRSANACLVPICAVANKQVITIEGIGNPNKPHPIQVILKI